MSQLFIMCLRDCEVQGCLCVKKSKIVVMLGFLSYGLTRIGVFRLKEVFYFCFNLFFKEYKMSHCLVFSNKLVYYLLSDCVLVEGGRGWVWEGH